MRKLFSGKAGGSFELLQVSFQNCTGVVLQSARSVKPVFLSSVLVGVLLLLVSVFLERLWIDPDLLPRWDTSIVEHQIEDLSAL